MPRPVKRWVWRGFGLVVAAYVLVCVAVFFGQKHVLYFPDARPLEACDLPDGAAFWRSEAERGIVSQSGQTRLLVFFHGNAGSAFSWRYLGVNHLERLGYDVLVLEYPGYRGDTRTPSREGIERATRTVGDWVAKQSYKSVVAMGYSLGTGAASLYARDFPTSQVILFAPYDSIYNVAWGKGFWFPRALLRESFDNMSALAQVRSPIDILHGAGDTVIPARHSANLHNVLRAQGRQVRRRLKQDATHQKLFDSPGFDAYMQDTLLHQNQ